MEVSQFRVMDQIDSKSQEFINKVVYNYPGYNSNTHHVEVRYRSLLRPCVALSVCEVKDEYISDDRIVEILINDKLIGIQYQRRDEFNWTEVTNIEI